MKTVRSLTRKRGRGPLALLAGTLTLAGAALVAAIIATASPASSDSPVIVDLGTLEPYAPDATGGDGFAFDDTSGTTTATEIFTANNQSRLSETDAPENLVTLSAADDGVTSPQTVVSLKSHEIGV